MASGAWQGGSGGAGDVVGPASSTDGNIAAFDGATGKLLKDGAIALTEILKGALGTTDNVIVRTNGTGGVTAQGTNLVVTDTNDLGIDCTPIAKLEVEDGGTAKSILLKITADDENPYALAIGNDTASTTDTEAIVFYMANDGKGNIVHNKGGEDLQIATRIGGGAVNTNQILLKPDNTVQFASLTASRVVVTDANKALSSSAVTSTELALLSGKTAILGGAIDSYMSISSYQSSSSVNNTTYYFLKEAMFDQVVTGIEVFVDSAGASNGIDIALYDSAGTTLLASKATPLSSFSSGKVRIPFDAPYTVVRGTLYWQGFSNANGGTATFVIGPTGINSSSFARVDAGVATCGATLPVAASTNARLAWNWY